MSAHISLFCPALDTRSEGADDPAFEIAEDDSDFDDELEDDDFDGDGSDDDDYPAAPTKILPPFEVNPDDDPADSDPNYQHDDDRTGPSFDF